MGFKVFSILGEHIFIVLACFVSNALIIIPTHLYFILRKHVPRNYFFKIISKAGSHGTKLAFWTNRSIILTRWHFLEYIFLQVRHLFISAFVVPNISVVAVQTIQDLYFRIVSMSND